MSDNFPTKIYAHLHGWMHDPVDDSDVPYRREDTCVWVERYEEAVELLRQARKSLFYLSGECDNIDAFLAREEEGEVI